MNNSEAKQIAKKFLGEEAFALEVQSSPQCIVGFFQRSPKLPPKAIIRGCGNDWMSAFVNAGIPPDALIT